MKNSVMHISTCFYLFLAFLCSGNEHLQTSVKLAMSTNSTNPTASVQTNPFSGSYTVNYQNTIMIINLVGKGNRVTGNFTVNNQEARIDGIVTQQLCTGRITEVETGKTYSFTAQLSGQMLNFSFAVPEQNNQLVKLSLKRLSSSPSLNSANRNKMLFGTWRYTEVLSSGSGQFYSSFSTDYFAKFNSDGTATIWTGKSAGGTNGVTIEGAKSGTIKNVNWYTEGKLLYLVDPITKQKSAVTIYIEANRMMLTSGKSKKVYQRVN